MPAHPSSPKHPPLTVYVPAAGTVTDSKEHQPSSTLESSLKPIVWPTPSATYTNVSPEHSARGRPAVPTVSSCPAASVTEQLVNVT